MLSIKQGGIKYHFWVFGMTRPGIEPRPPEPLVNTLSTRTRIDRPYNTPNKPSPLPSPKLAVLLFKIFVFVRFARPSRIRLLRFSSFVSFYILVKFLFLFLIGIRAITGITWLLQTLLYPQMTVIYQKRYNCIKYLFSFVNKLHLHTVSIMSN